MGADSNISWCHHTFNPWWGCTKVSAGCTSCYAEAWDKRVGGAHWGKGVPRREFGEKHWNEPRKWNRFAKESGKTQRVFCASMADVFDEEAPAGAIKRLWDLIRETAQLEWLLLTKRPENILRMLPADWGNDGWAHVWIGTSVEDQPTADQRVPLLLQCPAAVHWISAEPLLGPVNLHDDWLHGGFISCPDETDDPATDECRSCPGWTTPTGDYCGAVRGAHVAWIVSGGESGPGARPMHPGWARSLRDQCEAAGVAFFMKQDSGPRAGQQGRIPDDLWAVKEYPRIDPAQGVRT